MAKKDKLVKVRLLIDCEYGDCNTVAEVPAEAVEADQGRTMDDSPQAVAAVD